MGHDGATVLIVEPNPDGHRLYYAALLADGVRRRGHHPVVLTTPRAVASTEWGIHLADSGTDVETHAVEWFTLSRLAEAADRHAAEVTVVPDADRFLRPVLRHGWRGSGRLSLLAMRPDAQPFGPRALRPVKGVVKKVLIGAADARPRVRVSALRSPLSSRRGVIRWVADPITLVRDDAVVTDLRHRLVSEGQSYWAGVFGAIHARKNLHLIAEALTDHPDVGLLVAGGIDAESAELAREPLARYVAAGGSFVHIAPPLDDAGFDGAISAVDCVVVAHSNEGSSGVASKAAAAGRRLVLAGARSLRRDARALPGQASWSPLDAAALSAAIGAARDAGAPPTSRAASSDDFVSSLTWS